MGGKRGLRTKIRFSSDTVFTVFTTVFTFVPSLRQPVPLQEVGEHSGDFLCITWTSQGHGEVRRSVRGARVDRPRRRRRSAAHSPSERRAPIRKMRGERTSSKEEEASSPKKELLQELSVMELGAVHLFFGGCPRSRDARNSDDHHRSLPRLHKDSPLSD